MTPRPRRLPANAKIEPEVARTVEALRHEQPYAGAVRLALKYARAIDDAQAIAAAADRIEIDPAEDAAAYRELDKLRAKVAALTVLQDLGPRLLAVLVELRATPKARTPASAAGQDGGTSGVSASVRALAALRERASARADGAAAVDTPAP